MQISSESLDEKHASERAIRDFYAERLADFRPSERLIKAEHALPPSLLRGDMRTVDDSNRIRIWEFKIRAGYDGLGQILTYVALAREEYGFDRPVLGVLAAFEFIPELARAIEILNLGIETVILPEVVRFAGKTPISAPAVTVPRIPAPPFKSSSVPSGDDQL